MGQVIDAAMRKRIVLATKFGMPMADGDEHQGGSRAWILRAVEGSLARLKTDWIDLYQLHKPDPRTPLAETLRALDDLVRAGKVRYIGVSNMPAWQVVEANAIAREMGLSAYVSCQDEYSLLVRGAEAELMPMMRAHGLGLLPYFPLASGLLTGKYRRNAPMPEGARLTKTQRLADRYLTETNWAKSEKLADYAEAHGHTLLELAFAWLLAKAPVTSVIAGATKPEQIQQNVAAGGWMLDAASVADIESLL
jgi:aryl-alcohol dehydrogenase-like predicted oxidoreductase